MLLFVHFQENDSLCGVDDVIIQAGEVAIGIGKAVTPGGVDRCFIIEIISPITENLGYAPLLFLVVSLSFGGVGFLVPGEIILI